MLAVRGALLELTKPQNWEQFGTATPDELAEAMRLMMECFDMENPIAALHWIVLTHPTTTVPNGILTHVAPNECQITSSEEWFDAIFNETPRLRCPWPGWYRWNTFVSVQHESALQAIAASLYRPSAGAPLALDSRPAPAVHGIPFMAALTINRPFYSFGDGEVLELNIATIKSDATGGIVDGAYTATTLEYFGDTPIFEH